MNNSNELRGRDYSASPAAYVESAPRAWRWYIAYSACMALLYIGITCLGATGVSLGDEARYRSSIFLVIGPSLTISYAIAPFLPKKPWAWTYHSVLIVIGMTSVCCLPATLPLLLNWFKPEMKRYFGRI